ncbi:hypothetical protein [Citrobacter freundii]|uniref:hypothetical protein n=1 Tax=Citrobacter freundii TaxID=546 RepID=UPI0024C181B9|nr:hypothetical protein [Citrobacter freundii]WHW90828.1 hypothetical protein P0S03_16195 [Citrobacter freundii]
MMTDDEKEKVKAFLKKQKIKIENTYKNKILDIEFERDYALQRHSSIQLELEKSQEQNALLREILSRRKKEYEEMRELIITSRQILIDVKDEVSNDNKIRIEELI